MESVRKRREFRNNVEIEKEELRKNEAGSSSEDTPAYSQNEADWVWDDELQQEINCLCSDTFCLI